MGFSQNPLSLALGKSGNKFSDNAHSFNLKELSFGLSLTDKKSYADKYLLTIYNPTTQLNDNYTLVSHKYYNTFPSYNFNGIKKDSFNPNGVSDFGNALGFGLLNLLFEGF